MWYDFGCKRRCFMNIGEYIREVREDMKLSKDYLAHRTRVSSRSIRRIEEGLVSPKWSTLQRLFRVLKIEVMVCRDRQNINVLE